MPRRKLGVYPPRLALELVLELGDLGGQVDPLLLGLREKVLYSPLQFDERLLEFIAVAVHA